MRFSTAVAGFAGLAAVNAIATIETKGAKLFTSDGDQFFVKGIAYQLVPDDPLIDNTQCSLDAKLMKSIGTNSIRVYHVDPSAKHDDCMKTFEDAGIYIWLDLDTFDTQIEQTGPRWNQTQLDRFSKVMDAFHSYTNLAGFFVGNEVLTTGNGSVAAPYVKAAARDLKHYRDSKNYRKIPIGYSAADIATLRPMLQNYLACGTNASEALDFYSLNAYSWCGASSFRQSGYVDLIKNVTSVGYNIPIFLSETGCIEPSPRDFADQESIFGPDMTPNWSGAIIYEWIQEANNYGLVEYGPKVDPASPSAPPDGFPRSGTPKPRSPDFENLSNRWKTLNPTGIKASEYNPTLTAPPCPAFTSGIWEVDPKSSLPSLGQTFIAAQVTPGPGASGGSSNQQGGGSGSAAPSATQKGAASMSFGALSAWQNLFVALVSVLVWML
ncbi:glycoside hydrolase family 72 protein [Periconia macrospinosa]|uniref:1,3-beta-glucanosyltransferase n=1 Tax=Periconia macrospinosa TaxID=97972 RepID=A0A2V1E5J4_9PLEO|nr:glycoside hydrolase family 72 protein [Periconia macrospinosa]